MVLVPGWIRPVLQESDHENSVSGWAQNHTRCWCEAGAKGQTPEVLERCPGSQDVSSLQRGVRW